MGTESDYQALPSGEDVEFVSRRRKQTLWTSIFAGLFFVQSAAVWGLLWANFRPNTAILTGASVQSIPVFDTDYYQDEMQGWVPYITKAFNNHIRPDRHNERYIIEFEDGEPEYVGEPRPEIDGAWEEILSGA
ncbi:hypothetical protein CH63R_12063 [Colletotrichum higginsianum IMI 349063]|uniref:Uncharacterized protein n=1 Tax=Colletotrichum higginsianum (strain IMI 349063) TaxID=759273 RepID=A0A1B7Y029_COLHI|nr:hypothetical protein CH63R_12063 [Colletotrichum higginsianum IMI 349063]OBR05360.1 hypothetical protein CH63R_12063 [Colletotrichum higginsianum IMI 349063]